MANLNLIENLGWNVRQEPTEELTKNWEEQVLPGHNFSIIYKVGIPDPETGDDAYQLVAMEVPYETEGQPLAVADLLTTIYNFYQEPLDRNDPLRKPPRYTKRSDPIGDEVIFERLEEVAPNRYELTLELDDT